MKSSDFVNKEAYSSPCQKPLGSKMAFKSYFTYFLSSAVILYIYLLADKSHNQGLFADVFYPQQSILSTPKASKLAHASRAEFATGTTQSVQRGVENLESILASVSFKKLDPTIQIELYLLLTRGYQMQARYDLEEEIFKKLLPFKMRRRRRPRFGHALRRYIMRLQNCPTKLDFFVAESWEKRVWEDPALWLQNQSLQKVQNFDSKTGFRRRGGLFLTCDPSTVSL